MLGMVDGVGGREKDGLNRVECIAEFGYLFVCT